MKKYIWGRVIRSILSIFIVVTIALIMVYTMVPRSYVFQNDPQYSKLNANLDEKTRYKYNTWRRLGYMRFIEQKDMCSAESDDYSSCVLAGSSEIERIKEVYVEKGWTVESYNNGLLFAHKDYSVFELVTNLFGRLIKIDNPTYIKDANNTDLERKIYVATDQNGVPSLKCSGCQHKYLIYFDSGFPYIHQNIISLDFGISYPTFSGLDVGNVISTTQGNAVSSDVEFETGYSTSTAVNLHTCRYKDTLDTLDAKRFSDNYADCDSNLSDPSMIMTSFLFGIFGLIISYVIGIPGGMSMAAHKDKFADKMGIVYINIMIAVPSLAFIYFARFIGSMFGLPDKFPTLGAQDVRSYILPVIILALLSTAGEMIWVRRFMIDQASSDYVKFARAKGLSQKEIFRTHILRNAIIPLVQQLPQNVILTISGAVITETVFAIPGMGKMLPNSIKSYNNPMVIALTFIFTALSVFSLLIGDLLVTVVDPRIQLQAKGGSR